MSGLHQYQHSEHVRSKMNGVNHKQNLTERDNFIDKRSASTSLLPSTIDTMTNSNGMPNKKSPSQRSVQSLRSVSQYSNYNHLRNHTDPSSSVSLLDRSLVSLLKYVLLDLQKFNHNVTNILNNWVELYFCIISGTIKWQHRYIFNGINRKLNCKPI